MNDSHVYTINARATSFRTNVGFGFMKLLRVAVASLPFSSVPTLLTLFDIAFNIISVLADTTKQFAGAYSLIKLTPGALLINSPLLAKIQAGYSFPGYPISIKWIHIRIRNTTQLSEKAGRWEL